MGKQAELQGRLREALGEGPQYRDSEQCPFKFLRELLQWGAPAGADVAGCLTIQDASDGQSGSINLAALHAAGCFPHAWRAPLTAAGVQAANERGAAEPAPVPAGGPAGAPSPGSSRKSGKTWKRADGGWQQPLSSTACKTGGTASLGLAGGWAVHPAAPCMVPAWLQPELGCMARPRFALPPAPACQVGPTPTPRCLTTRPPQPLCLRT